LEAPGIGECEPISRPRLYKIAHSARFLQSGPLANSTGSLGRRGRPPTSPRCLPARIARYVLGLADPWLRNPTTGIAGRWHAQQAATPPPRRRECEQKSTEKNNAKIFAICSRSRIDVHFYFGSDGPRRHSKTQSAIPGPTGDCPRVRAIPSTTLDDLARASFPTHMGRASSRAVHIGGDARPRPCLQA
jgi:hypothetical protein